MHRGAFGFTLLELILVMALMGLLFGLVTPIVMATLDRVHGDTSVRKVASALRTARSKAIATKTPHTFNADMDTGRFWLANLRTEETGRVHMLERSIRFREFEDGNRTVRDGMFAIAFYPLGNTSGGRIVLEPEGKENPFYISVDPVTGRPRIQHGSK